MTKDDSHREKGAKMAPEKAVDKIRLTEEQEKEGYWAEVCQDRVLGLA